MKELHEIQKHINARQTKQWVFSVVGYGVLYRYIPYLKSISPIPTFDYIIAAILVIYVVGAFASYIYDMLRITWEQKNERDI